MKVKTFLNRLAFQMDAEINRFAEDVEIINVQAAVFHFANDDEILYVYTVTYKEKEYYES